MVKYTTTSYVKAFVEGLRSYTPAYTRLPHSLRKDLAIDQTHDGLMHVFQWSIWGEFHIIISYTWLDHAYGLHHKRSI